MEEGLRLAERWCSEDIVVAITCLILDTRSTSRLTVPLYVLRFVSSLLDTWPCSIAHGLTAAEQPVGGSEDII